MVSKTKTLVIAGMLTFAATSAYAAMAVYDGTAIAKMAEQLSEMKKSIANQLEQIAKLKEQITVLNDIQKVNKETSSAIGSMASISVPITSIASMASQLRKDASCLFPTVPGFGIDFNNVDTSLCDRTARYRSAFFTDQKTIKTMSWSEQAKVRGELASRREKFASDTVSRALAAADIQQKTAEEQGQAADQLQQSLDSAKTLQDRANISAQIGIAQLRATAQQTQLLAQMLKLQSAFAMQFGVNPEIAPAEELIDDEGEE